MDDLTDTPQRLHDSEINASLSWFYDDGFKWELGDNVNGWTTDGRASTAREANELAENAFAEFPARSSNGGRKRVERRQLVRGAHQFD